MASRTRTVGEIEAAEEGSPGEEGSRRENGSRGDIDDPAGNPRDATDHSGSADTSAGPLPNPPDVRQ